MKLEKVEQYQMNGSREKLHMDIIHTYVENNHKKDKKMKINRLVEQTLYTGNRLDIQNGNKLT